MTCLEKLPKVNRCCCCIPLGVGVKILAFLGLIGAIWEICRGLYFTGFEAYIYVIIQVTNLVLSVFLARGAFKRKPGYIKIWLIGQWFAVIATILFYAFLDKYLESQSRLANVSEEDWYAYLIIGFVLALAIFVWFWLTVNTFYVQLLESENQPSQSTPKDVPVAFA